MSMRAIKARSLGRLQLLEWLNAFLESDYSRVEHLKDGIAFAQVLDAVNPGKVALHRLNFNAHETKECEANLRVLDKALLACKLDKEIPRRRIAKGNFQDTFELLQWSYEYLHSHYPDADYNYRAFDRRRAAMEKQRARRARKGAVGPLASPNPNLVPKSYSIAPGVKKTPPVDVVLAGGGSPSSGSGAGARGAVRHRGRGGPRLSRSPTSPSDSFRLKSLNDEFEQMLVEASKDGFRVPQSPMHSARPRSIPTHRDLRTGASPTAAVAAPASGNDAFDSGFHDDVGGGASRPPPSRPHRDAADTGMPPDFNDLVLVLQRDLTKRVSWQQDVESKLLDLREHRNQVFAALRGVERLCVSIGRGTDAAASILDILRATPDGFPTPPRPRTAPSSPSRVSATAAPATATAAPATATNSPSTPLTPNTDSEVPADAALH